MWPESKPQDQLDGLSAQIQLASALSPKLFASIAEQACKRLQVLNRAGHTSHLNALINAGAWSDAVLALITLELPAWKMRRLVYEDGEWLCSLTKEPNLPLSLDDTADATHEVLALAILGAFLEARRRASVRPDGGSSRVPQVRPINAICCDNFI